MVCSKKKIDGEREKGLREGQKDGGNYWNKCRKCNIDKISDGRNDGGSRREDLNIIIWSDLVR